MKNSLLTSLTITLSLFCSCTRIIDSEKIPGHNNLSISGTLTLRDGITRADNAMVILRPSTTLGMVGDISGSKVSAIDTTLTNKNGEYEFQGVENSCTYSIEARKDNNAVFIKSIEYTTESSVDLGTDTLKPTGVISGNIYLSGGGDIKNVYILVFGIDRFTHANQDGTFNLKELGEGSYALRIISANPGYGIHDTAAITVISNDTTNIGCITLPFSGISIPKNLNVSYDEKLLTATVSWSPSTAGSIRGYNVYLRAGDRIFEKISDTSSARISDSIVTDTFFRVDVLEYQNQTIQFAVTAIDSHFVESGYCTSEPKQLNSTWLGKPINFSERYSHYNDGVYLTRNKIFVVYRTSTNSLNICEYNQDGKLLNTWSPYTSNNIDITNTFFVDITFDTDGNCYISENERICKFDSSFKLINSLSGNDAVSYLSIFAGIDSGVICLTDLMLNEGGPTRFYNSKLQLLGTWKAWAGHVEDFRILSDTIILAVDIPKMSQTEKWIVYLDRKFNEIGKHEITLSQIVGNKIPGKRKRDYMSRIDLLTNGGFIIHANGESLEATELLEFDSSWKLCSRNNLLYGCFASDRNCSFFIDNKGNQLPQILVHCQ